MVFPTVRSLPVLMYHSISRRESKRTVSPELFADHCASLVRAGWRGLTLAEAEAYFLRQGKLPRKTCLITFDDGYLDNYLVAAPILRQYGLCGVIFPVMALVAKEGVLRSPEKTPDLDSPPSVMRKGQLVRAEQFCSVTELREMMRQGVMTPAPHSLRHERVAVSPEFSWLMCPGGVRGYFSMPTYGAVWGMPAFKLRHGLASRAFRPSARLLRLVRSRVPQKWDEALEYLSVPTNTEGLIKDIQHLETQGLLGAMESEEQYRARLFKEFTACRSRFSRMFGVSPVSFCWPWGDYNYIALEEARRAGFRLFFTTAIGANALPQPHRVHRFKVDSIAGSRLLWQIRAMALRPVAAIAGAWLRRSQNRSQKNLAREQDDE